MAETADYPLIERPERGSAHLRIYATDAAATRDADVAAVAVALGAAGHHVEVSARDPHKVVARTGRGWHDPHLRVARHDTLLSVTAAVAEAWQRSDRPVALVCDNWFDLRTGPGPSHDDTTGDAWLAAVTSGDTRALFACTGLDLATYLGGDPEPTPVTVVVSSTPRRGGRPDDLAAVKGGHVLVARCDSVCTITADRHEVDGTVTGTATWHKHRYGTVGVHHSGETTSHWTRT